MLDLTKTYIIGGSLLDPASQSYLAIELNQPLHTIRVQEYFGRNVQVAPQPDGSLVYTADDAEGRGQIVLTLQASGAKYLVGVVIAGVVNIPPGHMRGGVQIMRTM